MAADSSGGLKNSMIDQLEDAHLVRKDRRRGRTWIELAHDRLVRPVRQSNNAWFRARRLGSFRRAAPWLVGGALALIPFLFVSSQPAWPFYLMLAGAGVLVYTLSHLLTSQLARQRAMEERSIWLYKNSRSLGQFMALSNALLLFLLIAFVVLRGTQVPPGVLLALILVGIGACMLFIPASLAGADALGRQIARLRLPYDLGFFALDIALLFLMFATLLLLAGLILPLL
jgi:hypothetical protein